MSASLVGSEMCIRDRPPPSLPLGTLSKPPEETLFLLVRFGVSTNSGAERASGMISEAFPGPAQFKP
eukprot:6754942-Alexandrium_andersonii.AAC.1